MVLGAQKTQVHHLGSVTTYRYRQSRTSGRHEGVKILAVEPRWFERGVREAIHIRMEQPSLNKDGGGYNLLSIWNNMLRSGSWGLASKILTPSGASSERTSLQRETKAL